MKAGYVSIVGLPNAGKSTLLNALVGEKLAIVSPKVQTTRHRIRAILNGEGYQAVLSDTPGIIDPKYKLHEKMMKAVQSAVEDADLLLLLVDAQEDPAAADAVFSRLPGKIPAIVAINKVDGVDAETLTRLEEFFRSRPYTREILRISALQGFGLMELLDAIVGALPEGHPFFEGEEISDLPERFFVSELIREAVFHLYEEEIPYHTTVVVNTFQQKSTLVKISAEIVVQRETQKAIILGEGGRKIRDLGTRARADIEAFLGRKVFLELFVKVRPKWRDNEQLLRQYGYR